MCCPACWDCWKNAAAACAEGARMAWALAPPDPVVLAGMLPQENIQNTQYETIWFFKLWRTIRYCSVLSAKLHQRFDIPQLFCCTTTTATTLKFSTILDYFHVKKFELSTSQAAIPNAFDFTKILIVVWRSLITFTSLDKSLRIRRRRQLPKTCSNALAISCLFSGSLLLLHAI